MFKIKVTPKGEKRPKWDAERYPAHGRRGDAAIYVNRGMADRKAASWISTGRYTAEVIAIDPAEVKGLAALVINTELNIAARENRECRFIYI